MKRAAAIALEYFSQRKERGEPDLYLSQRFDRSAFLASLAPDNQAPVPSKSSASKGAPRATFISPGIAKTTRPAASAASNASGRRDALKQLFFAMAGCARCSLGKTRTKLVFGSGNAEAAIMIIGEAPGTDEDAQGLPFVGKAGQLLTQMLGSINLDRTKDVFITTVVKCCPPEDRDPEEGEIQACRECLQSQIEIIKPKIILLLGRVAAAALLGIESDLQELRGSLRSYKEIPVAVTYHPAALLRKEEYKRGAWEDLKKFEAQLQQLGIR